jgi:hypothetical protein
MDNIENNILRVIKEDNNLESVDEALSLSDVSDFFSGITTKGSETVKDFTNSKIESFFSNPVVESVLTKLVTKLIINNPIVLEKITNNVLNNIRINVEKK